MAEIRKKRRLSESGSFQAEDVPPAEESPKAPAKPQMRRELFVRSLPPSATTESLTEFFSQSYVLKHATVVLDPQTKQSKGYGFVTFADIEDAQRAVEELNGAEFEGKKIKVEVAQPRQREIDEKVGKSVPSTAASKFKEERARQREQFQPPKLIVRNLPWTITEPDQLAALFRSFGKVKHAVVPKKGNVQAGFGFVTLRGRKNAEKALEAVNGKEVDGRSLAVDWAVDKSVWEDAQKSTDQVPDKDEGADDHVMEAVSEEDQDEGPATASDDVSMQDDDQSIDVESDEEDEEEDEGEDEMEDVEDERNASTVFIRNLPFTSSDDTLYEHFKQFGPVRYARIVVDYETERPRGTGFVCFYNVEDAISCIREAPKQPDIGQQDNDKSKKPATGIKHSVLQNDMLDPTGRYTMEDRVLIVTRAVSKPQATKLTEDGASRRFAQDRDKRRLFLLNEGTISSNSPLYKKLAPSEIKMREDSLKQRQTIIKNNPTLHLSLTRLSVRNLPRQVTSKDLKALAREAIVGFAKDVKGGLRQPLSHEELQRGVEETKENEKARREKGKGLVKQAKIVFEGRDGSKIEEKSGGGRSRGYGFIEYFNHRHALMGLRWLNGHAVESRAADGTNEKKKRLITEFAIENAQVVQRRNEYQERMRAAGKMNDKSPRRDKSDASARFNRGTKRKRFESRDEKASKPKDSDGKAEVEDEEKNKTAKRNRIIARKRMQRRERRGKA
jgi:nucleolar protein 4